MTRKKNAASYLIIRSPKPRPETRHNSRPPWPGMSRPSTPSCRSTECAAKTWVAGTSPAKGIGRCAEFVTHNWLLFPGQPRDFAGRTDETKERIMDFADSHEHAAFRSD